MSAPSLHRVYRLTDNTSECNSKQEASLAVFETMQAPPKLSQQEHIMISSSDSEVEPSSVGNTYVLM